MLVLQKVMENLKTGRMNGNMIVDSVKDDKINISE